MFDNPKKHLQWMEEELLAEENTDEPEDISAEDPGDDWEQLLMDDWDPTEPPKNNPAVNFGRAFYQYEILDEEPAALLTPTGTAQRIISQNQKKEKHRREKQAKQKEKGIGGLIFLALLELLGIFMIIGWWILWLL